MSTADNRKLVEYVFNETAKGNPRPFLEAMADDFSWTVTGTTSWSRKYEGKQTVLGELFGPLAERVVTPMITIPRRVLADGEFVVVEAEGQNTTRDGRPYNNRYCFVFRVSEGKLREVTEYLDTELVTKALT
jgi:ketosteroid isomerase-like protein